MRRVKMISGNLAKSGTGNLTCYNKKDEQFFVPKRHLESQGWVKESDIKFPFYAIVGEKTFTPWDENGKPIEMNGVIQTATRLQVMQIFTTEDALIQSEKEDAMIDLKIAKSISDEGKDLGLSQQLTDGAIKQLLAMSI